MLEKTQQQRIATEVIRTLKSRFEEFPNATAIGRNAPFHVAFMQAFSKKVSDAFGTTSIDIPFFMGLNSWFHGLNTSLGQSFFENVAYILSAGEKKTIKGKLISQRQQTVISEIMTGLKNGTISPNVSADNDLLLLQKNEPCTTPAPDFTVDCYIEDNDTIICIELKTVKPNSATFRSEKEKILAAKAVLKNENPHKQIFYYMAFPFDPTAEATPGTGYNKKTFLDSCVDGHKFLADEEILLADEFWSFLSKEQNTMEQIIGIIRAIANPDFLDCFDFISNQRNFENDPQNFLNILEKWKLFDDCLIFKNLHMLKDLKLPENENKKIRLSQNLNKSIFKNNAEYNTERRDALLKAITFLHKQQG